MAQLPPPPAALAQKAERARDAGQSAEALKLYQQAVTASHAWAEGWFWIGSLHYEAERYPACRDAFRRFVRLSPKAGPGYAVLGICQYRLNDKPSAMRSFEKAFELGLPDDPVTTEARFAHARLLIASGNFERALLLMGTLARQGSGSESPELITLAGIAALRKPVAPEDLTDEDRPVVLRTGRAMVTSAHRQAPEARRMLDDLVADYPQYPNLHYVFGAFLMGGDPDRALAEFTRELEIQPAHVPALVSLAIEHLNRAEPDKALPYAQRAAQAAPGNFAARTAYGRALAESGRTADAVKELEIGAKLAPDSPQAFLALASAYQKLGRKQDAARARAEFARLKKAIDARPPQ